VTTSTAALARQAASASCQRVREAGAGRPLEGDVVTGQRGLDRDALLGVEVEHGWASGDHGGDRLAHRQHGLGHRVEQPPEQRVPGEGRQRGDEVGQQRLGAGGEAPDEHARVDGEPLDAGARVVEHGVDGGGVEAVDAEGEAGERLGVEPHAVHLAQRAQQLGVH
jgi:hypothetical protein